MWQDFISNKKDQIGIYKKNNNTQDKANSMFQKKERNSRSKEMKLTDFDDKLCHCTISAGRGTQ
jgi:hypothetical protein